MLQPHLLQNCRLRRVGPEASVGAGNVLYENDDILLDSDTNSRLSMTLQPGDHTIETTTCYARTSGDFTLTIAGLGSSQ